MIDAQPTRSNILATLIDEALVNGLPAPLKSALGRALAGGCRPELLMLVVRRLTGGPMSPRGGLTYLAIEAFVEQRCDSPL